MRERGDRKGGEGRKKGKMETEETRKQSFLSFARKELFAYLASSNLQYSIYSI
jgi:hypothetical protein